MSESSKSETDQADRNIDPQDLLNADLEKKIHELKARDEQQKSKIKELEEQVKKLEALLSSKIDAKSSKTPTFSENYSLGRNKNASKVSGEKAEKVARKRPGRKPTSGKEHLVTQTIVVFAEGIDRKRCVHHRFQSAWRIVDGKAVYIRYDIRDLLGSTDLPLPPGLRSSRSEFGTEIILILAFLHYWVGVSQDNAIQIMSFFTGLDLAKSQADSLLSQLSRDWEQQHDTIAELIALQMIVYIDETGWKVGKKSCYTWVFSTAMHVLFRCGVSRKKIEATDVLGDDFAGIGVTDDYAAYKNMFSEHQLCWAHLIRKAIKLTLQNPDESEYAEFLDSLCQIYHDAKQLSDGVAAEVADAPLENSVHRQTVIQKLKNRIISLCSRSQEPIVTPKAAAKAVTNGMPAVRPTAIPLATFIHLQRELAGNVDCLFVFVKHPEVEPTNNRSERNVRREAEIRKGARTSKTRKGAKRRSIIVTVLASLQTRIENFTLANLLDEVQKWWGSGTSLFKTELEALQKNRPPPTQNNHATI